MTKRQIVILIPLLLMGYLIFCGVGYLIGRSTVPTQAPIATSPHRPTSTPKPTTTPYGRVTSFAKPIAPFIVTGGDYPTEAAAYLTGIDDAMQKVYLICQEADVLLADEQLSIAEFGDRKISLSVQVNMVMMETVDELVPPADLHEMHQNFRQALQCLSASIGNHPAPDEAYMFDKPYISLSGDEPLDSAGQLAEAVRLLELAWEARQTYLSG